MWSVAKGMIITLGTWQNWLKFLALRKREKKMIHLFQEVEKEVVKARKKFVPSPLQMIKNLKGKITNEQSSAKEEAYGRK